MSEAAASSSYQRRHHLRQRRASRTRSKSKVVETSAPNSSACGHHCSMSHLSRLECVPSFFEEFLWTLRISLGSQIRACNGTAIAKMQKVALPCRDDTSAAVRSSSTQCTLKCDTSRTHVDAEECVCTSSQLLLPTSRTSTDIVSFSLEDLPCSFLCVAGQICSPEHRRPWGAYTCDLP